MYPLHYWYEVSARHIIAERSLFIIRHLRYQLIFWHSERSIQKKNYWETIPKMNRCCSKFTIQQTKIVLPKKTKTLVLFGSENKNWEPRWSFESSDYLNKERFQMYPKRSNHNNFLIEAFQRNIGSTKSRLKACFVVHLQLILSHWSLVEGSKTHHLCKTQKVL